jgi:response regulator RpfG family c-di-GMP phosphodiesterase
MELSKKILVIHDIKSVITKGESFFKREHVQILTSSSNEEALSIHKDEQVDLIITNLDSPQMDGKTFCSLIRDDVFLQRVSIIIVYPDIKPANEMLSQCRANAFIREPINLSLLSAKAQQLLNIAQRESLRAPVAVKVQGKYKGQPFLCISENISATGMLFQTEKIIHKGDVIACSFFLPNSVHIMTEAEIVRVVKKKTEFDTHHYGIKFSKLKRKERSAIETYTKEELRRLKIAFDSLEEK